MSAGDEFEVQLPELISGAGRLAGHAGDVDAVGGGLAGASRTAGGECGGGPLAGSLARLSQQFSARSEEMGAALHAAADTATGNAQRYAGDDAAAAAGLGATWSRRTPDF